MTKEESVPTDNLITKMNECVQVNLRITTNSNQGGRKYMEDAYAIALQRSNQSDKESPISLAYFGIFDGHGGKEAAEFARQHLCQHILEQDEFWSNNSDEQENDQIILKAIRKGFLACHNNMWNHVEKWAKTSSGLPSTSGCTASVVFIRGNKLYIGHVGDSAIVLGEGESLYKSWKATRLTRDHKPEDPSELKRIRESGGNVLCKAGVHRVVWNRQKSSSHSSHQYRHRHSIQSSTTTSTATTVEYEQIPFLAVSRALGDLWSLNNQTNLYAVSPEPDLLVIDINSTKHRCLILASDGLWNMVTPETAVEIVRHCDVKTEEMILKSDDDDHRPFRNPSHELVQKALTCWRERMLRSDNITCITVMLDPTGLPFSDCIVQKKKQRLTYSTSSSTASICSDDTVELDQLTSMTTSSTPSSTITTPNKRKPSLLRKEHILTPISNGPTPVRTPKRPASNETPNILVDLPRRKQLKTNQQKENGRNSSSVNINSSESEMFPSVSSSSTLSNLNQSMSSIDDQLKVTLSDDNNDDLIRNVEECLRNHLDQMSNDDESMDLDQSSTKIFNDDQSKKIQNENKKQIYRSTRKRSISMIDIRKKPIRNRSHRRNSCSHVHRKSTSNNEINNSEFLSTIDLKEKEIKT